ncbi:MAG: phage tail protein [Campylobacteraceae bacterium]|nr:phage tail protein [Campylobacteraceae bacterium]
MILTTQGQQKIASLIAGNSALSLSSIALGDMETTPSPDALTLQNEVYRAAVSSVYRHPNNNAIVVAEAYIPIDIGGFYIREIGVYDNDNTLVAVGNYPETYKETMEEGSATDLKIKVMLLVSNAAQVTLVAPPSDIYATNEQLGVVKEDIIASDQEIARAHAALDIAGSGTGFVDREQCTITFERDPYKMVIEAKDPERGFDVSYHGKIYTKFRDEIDIDWIGHRYIIYADNGAGDLVSVQYPTHLDHVIAAYVYFSPTSEDPYIVAADERHQSERNAIIHFYDHLTRGCSWLGGGGISYKVNGEDDPNLYLNNIWISDEGLEFDIEHSAAPYEQSVSERVLQQNLQPLETNILYQNNLGIWMSDEVTPGQPIVKGVTIEDEKFLSYNTPNGGGNFQTAMSEGDYISYWVVTTNSKVRPVRLVQAQASHEDIDECLSDEFKALGLNIPEIIALWQVIYQFDPSIRSNANPYGAKLIRVVSPKRTIVGGEQVFNNASHNSLPGRTEALSHPTSAIFDIERNKSLSNVLTDIEEETARVLSIAENGRNRGVFETYAELEAYETTTVKDGDYVYVNADENHNNETWRYDWADVGDVYQWVAVLRVNEVVRNFTNQPIEEEELASAITETIAHSLQDTQLKTTEPDASSADNEITSAKQLFSIFGFGVNALLTTAKNVIGAINELKNMITNLTFEALAPSEMKGKSARGINMATNAVISVEMSGLIVQIRKTSSSTQFELGFTNASSGSNSFVYHLSHQYGGTSSSRYYDAPTLNAGQYEEIHNLMNYGGNCFFTCALTNLTTNKFYLITGQGEGNNIRFTVKLISE